MITIDQLLESVDLDFVPRWVAKDGNGDVYIFEHKPEIYEPSKQWQTTVCASGLAGYEGLKLSEFEGKDWTECIYEVPRKTTGKIDKLLEQKLTIGKTKYEYPTHAMLMGKINELVNYVNALIKSNNIHEKQIDELQMKIEPEKYAVNELKAKESE